MNKIILKVKVLQREIITSTEHELGCKFKCRGVEVLSTACENPDLEIMDFDAVYIGDLVNHYLTFVSPGEEYVFSGAKKDTVNGGWELVIQGISRQN